MRALGITTEAASDGIDDALAARALAERAQRLAGPLAERYPIVSEVLGQTRTPTWILVVLLLLAFAAGLGLSALDGSRRINILAFPLLGLIAWNLVTYAVLAVAWVRRHRGAQAQSTARGHWAGKAFARRIGPLVRQTARVHAVLAKAISAYAASWADLVVRSSRSTRGAGCTWPPRPWHWD